MFVVLSYDVVDDKRRTRVLKLLKGYGTHVQYSVFECELTTQQIAQVGAQLRQIIDPHTDSVRCYLLDTAAVRRIEVLGIGQVSTDPLYYLVGAT